jgi:hypothetical protein
MESPFCDCNFAPHKSHADGLVNTTMRLGDAMQIDAKSTIRADRNSVRLKIERHTAMRRRPMERSRS